MAKEMLNILWTSGDPVTAELMVLMYAPNALKYKWWEQVRVIIWGAAVQLAAEDEHIRALIRDAMRTGVDFSACVACAKRLGAVPALEDLRIEVIPWGEPLTLLLKNDDKLISV